MYKSKNYYSVKTPARRPIWYDEKAAKAKGPPVATCTICNRSIGQFEPQHYYMNKPQIVTCHTCYLRKEA